MGLPDNVVPQDAATVMLLRDGQAGIEVFMMRRNLDAEFVGGAYVFPGGKVDPDDGSDAVERLCIGLDDVEASRRLSLPRGGLAFWVAAVRECFEEAGVLLADGITDYAALAVYRKTVHSGEVRLADMCETEGLLLTVGGIHYHSHWITPIGSQRRFDTRFFVALVPTQQTPVHDDAELIASMWVRPIDALDMYERGEIYLITPTHRSLRSLLPYDFAADAVGAAAARTDVDVILPRVVDEPGGIRILIAGDVGYEEAL